MCALAVYPMACDRCCMLIWPWMEAKKDSKKASMETLTAPF
uniref:Uncharacterized protein n=1 Tax=Tetranychus urticae TaxID=32264 RepID=T1L1X5_TETUR